MVATPRCRSTSALLVVASWYGRVLVERAREEWVDVRPVVEAEVKQRVANVVSKVSRRKPAAAEAQASA